MMDTNELRISVVVEDITKLDADVIVNAANEGLLRGAGVCGAIFRAAGPQLETACSEVAPCPTGDARITPGFNARARWIVHAVGPVWHGGDRGEPGLLASAYRRSLEVAAEAGAHSIAFPAISTGIYGYPLDAATAIAVRTVRDSAVEGIELVRFVCFDGATLAAYERELGAPN